MEATARTRRTRFGAFEVDLRSGDLYKHGVRLKLQDQPFQVLALLLEHAGDVVTRDELRQKLWPADTFVDFDTGLNSAIKKLRDALGDSAEEPRYIETLPRRGLSLHRARGERRFVCVGRRQNTRRASYTPGAYAGFFEQAPHCRHGRCRSALNCCGPRYLARLSRPARSDRERCHSPGEFCEQDG